ncbi:MAG: AMP-dependent synthetase [Gammaproteobacteria bacterium]|nr:MAG: AMP-dependent synthetase [Gammaproteobacteria bacterium]PIE36354.1 MAG: AMP-dependent synthetase [Gammaproteobacteria bacterium]
MHEFDTLNDALLARRHSNSTVRFIAASRDDRVLGYGDVFALARDRLGLFRDRGIGTGDELIISVTDNLDFVVAFWACLLGGIVAVPIAAGSTEEHRLKLLRVAGKLSQPALFVDRKAASRLAAMAAGGEHEARWQLLESRVVYTEETAPLVADDADSKADPSRIPAWVHPASPDSIAFIQFSSGSTSAPKGVVLTHGNLVANLAMIMQGMAISADDSVFSWMPLTHDMGLIGMHLTPLLADCDNMLMATELFVRRPAAWLQRVSELRASITSSPNFGYQHLLRNWDEDRHGPVDLASVRLIFNGAEPISAELCEAFMTRLAGSGLDSDAMFPVYGLAEASLAVSFPPLDARWQVESLDRGQLGVGQQVMRQATGKSAIRLVSVGQPLDGVEVAIRDRNGIALAQEHVGRVHIRGPNVTRGYLDAPDINRELISDDGWLDTGDLGVIIDGRLYITGRDKDILFVSGLNVYPHDLEDVLIRDTSLERGKLAVSSRRSSDNSEDELLVFVQHRGDTDAFVDTVRTVTRVLAMKAGVKVSAVIPTPRIPRTTSGKVQRFALVEQYANGELVAVMDPRNVAGNT